MKKLLFFASLLLISGWMACSNTNDPSLLPIVVETEKSTVIYSECICATNLYPVDGENIFSPIENRSDNRLAAINLPFFVQLNNLSFGDTLEIEYVFTENLFDERRCYIVCDLVNGISIELKEVIKK